MRRIILLVVAAAALAGAALPVPAAASTSLGASGCTLTAQVPTFSGSGPSYKGSGKIDCSQFRSRLQLSGVCWQKYVSGGWQTQSASCNSTFSADHVTSIFETTLPWTPLAGVTYRIQAKGLVLWNNYSQSASATAYSTPFGVTSGGGG